MKHWFKNYIKVKQLINPEYAAFTKNRLALLYAFGAWNIFGLVVAAIYKQKIPKTHDSLDYAKVLGIKEAKVMKFSNLTMVDEYDINLTDQELDDFTKVVGTKEELEAYEQQNEERIKAAQEKKQQSSNR